MNVMDILIKLDIEEIKYLQKNREEVKQLRE
ncbi:hypothetical protein LISA103140_05580 [Ligilactobacillus salivarius]